MVERQQDITTDEILNQVPHIGIVYAGGTISSIKTAGGFREGGHDRNLMSMLQDNDPKFVNGRFTLGEPVVVFTGLSENMTQSNRVEIRRTLSGMIDSGEYDSIVLTHGTDSMEITVNDIDDDLVIREKLKSKGMKIVVTGAEYDADDPKTDVWNNLKGALNTALDKNLNPGVFVSFHGRVIQVKYVVKRPYMGVPTAFDFLDVRSREYEEAMIAANDRALGLAEKLHLHLYGKSLADLVSDEEYKRKRSLLENGTLEEQPEVIKDEGVEDLIDIDVTSDPLHKVFEYRVDVSQPDHFDMLALKESWLFPEAKSVLLTFYHSGTANTTDQLSSVVQLVKGLCERRGIVFFACAENDEPIDLHAYETSVALRNAGVVPLYDIPYYAALVKLRWAVEQTENPAEIIDLMLTNLLGEIDPKRIYEEDIRQLKMRYSQIWESIQKSLSSRTPGRIFWESHFKK